MEERTDPAWPPPLPGWRHDAPDPPDAFPVPFSVADGFALTVWTLLAQLLIGAPLIAAGFRFDDSVVTLLVLGVMQLVTLGGVAAWLAARGRLSWRLLGPVRPRLGHVGSGIGIGVAGFLITTIVVLVITQLVGSVEPPEQQVLETSAAGGARAVVGAIVAVLLAPLVEEAVFRGVLFQALKRRLGLFPGLFLSAATFAVVHVELGPAHLFALLVLGIWFAGAFHRTGSLVVPIVAHATFNAVTLTLAILAPSAT